MVKLKNIVSHSTAVLSMMFLVFLLLDLFNPMMNFVDNKISRILLALLCLSGLMGSIALWKTAKRPGRTIK